MNSDKPKLLEVDSRNRVSLGKLAEHGLYLAHMEPSGTIILTPVLLMVRDGIITTEVPVE